jgi:hypothetical protein
LENNVGKDGTTISTLTFPKISGLKKKTKYYSMPTRPLETNGQSYLNTFQEELIIASRTIGIQQFREN